eukprot:g8729.t1
MGSEAKLEKQATQDRFNEATLMEHGKQGKPKSKDKKAERQPLERLLHKVEYRSYRVIACCTMHTILYTVLKYSKVEYRSYRARRRNKQHSMRLIGGSAASSLCVSHQPAAAYISNTLPTYLPILACAGGIASCLCAPDEAAGGLRLQRTHQHTHTGRRAATWLAEEANNQYDT